MLETKADINYFRKRKAKDFSGEKFQAFADSLIKNFTHVRPITAKPKMPEYMVVERAIAVAVISQKSNKYYSIDKEKASR